MIVSDRNDFYGNHQCSDCNDRNDPSDHMEIIQDRDRVCPAILTTLAIIWKSILSDCDDRSDRMFSMIAINNEFERKITKGNNRLAPQMHKIKHL